MACNIDDCIHPQIFFSVLCKGLIYTRASRHDTTRLVADFPVTFPLTYRRLVVQVVRVGDKSAGMLKGSKSFWLD